MTHKHVDLLKRTLIEELGYTLAGCVLAAFVLFLYGLFATAQTSLLAQGDKLFYFFKLIAHSIVVNLQFKSL